MLRNPVQQIGVFAQKFDISFLWTVQQVRSKKVVQNNKPLFDGFPDKLIHFGKCLVQVLKGLIGKRKHRGIFKGFHCDPGRLPGDETVVSARKHVFGKKIGGEFHPVSPAIKTDTAFDDEKNLVRYFPRFDDYSLFPVVFLLEILQNEVQFTVSKPCDLLERIYDNLIHLF